jgi:hypothetical protein
VADEVRRAVEGRLAGVELIRTDRVGTPEQVEALLAGYPDRRAVAQLAVSVVQVAQDLIDVIVELFDAAGAAVEPEQVLIALRNTIQDSGALVELVRDMRQVEN